MAVTTPDGQGLKNKIEDYQSSIKRRTDAGRTSGAHLSL